MNTTVENAARFNVCGKGIHSTQAIQLAPSAKRSSLLVCGIHSGLFRVVACGSSGTLEPPLEPFRLVLGTTEMKRSRVLIASASLHPRSQVSTMTGFFA